MIKESKRNCQNKLVNFAKKENQDFLEVHVATNIQKVTYLKYFV